MVANFTLVYQLLAHFTLNLDLVFNGAGTWRLERIYASYFVADSKITRFRDLQGKNCLMSVTKLALEWYIEFLADEFSKYYYL